MSCITEPGVYNIDEAAYHADPMRHDGGSLSSSELKRLVECPAKYSYWKGREQHKDTFDFGKAAHSVVLGQGAPITVVDAPDWRTKDARAAKAEAHDNGHTPMLTHHMEVVDAMAAALRTNELAAQLLDSDHGKPEQSLFWTEQDQWMRARLDWLRNEVDDKGRLFVPDYKTAVKADVRSFERAAVDYGYHQQDAHYSDGLAVLLDLDPQQVRFVFIVQEKDPPFVVSVIELSPELKAIGADRNRRGLEVFRECVESGVWPAYSDERIERAVAPPWVSVQHADNRATWGWPE